MYESTNQDFVARVRKKWLAVPLEACELFSSIPFLFKISYDSTYFMTHFFCQNLSFFI